MKILILMSTWNGATYIETQLNSILSQRSEVDMHVLIRDDGSQDNTIDLLKKYNPTDVTIISGRNIGVKSSFFELMRLAINYKVDFYALADQDDYWLPEKISRAVGKINSQAPTLYCSSLNLVDRNLNFLSNYKHPGRPTFASSLLCNFATGCTCVFNRSLLERFCPPVNSSEIMMHDWWLANTAAAYGTILYDTESYILYRQHESNQIGIARGWQGFVSRWRKFWHKSQSPSRLTQAVEFNTAYTDIPKSEKEILDLFLRASASLCHRIIYVWNFRSGLSMLSAIRFIMRG